jgi:hypothetical protein
MGHGSAIRRPGMGHGSAIRRPGDEEMVAVIALPAHAARKPPNRPSPSVPAAGPTRPARWRSRPPETARTEPPAGGAAPKSPKSGQIPISSPC